MKPVNRKKTLLVVFLFMFFQMLMVQVNIVRADAPEHNSIFPGVNASTDINSLMSCTVTDNESDTMNASWFYNDYNEVTIIDENCNTFDAGKWTNSDIANIAPDPFNGYWYLNVSAMTNNGAGARYFLQNCSFGYYYVKFKVNTNCDGTSLGLLWIWNQTNGDEVDLFETDKDELPHYEIETNLHTNFGGPGEHTQNLWFNSATNFYNNEWHELEMIYDPTYISMRLDNEIIMHYKDGKHFNYQDVAPYFVDIDGWFVISCYADGTNADPISLVVDQITVKTGDYHNFATDNNIANNTNISNYNTANFTAYNNTYFWRLNVSDGMGEYSNESYFFHTSAEAPGTGPYGVSYGTPNPTNISSDKDLNLDFSINMNSNYNFNWTIECNNSDTSNGNGASSGSKTLSISSLAYATEYTVWVNATDNDTDYYRVWFTFTTTGPPDYGVSYGTPAPVNGSTDRVLDFIYRISINSNYVFDWTMECNNSDTSNGNGASNGTKELTLSSLAYDTEYTVWVNSTDNGTDYYRVWFTFTTEADDTTETTPNYGSGLVNWTEITQNFVEWSLQGYVIALGFLLWPIIFTAVIGYVYLKQQSLVAAAMAALIIFAAFFDALVLSIQPWINILYILVAACISTLFLFLFLRRRVR